jgi:acetyltransferase-like isoleucine patch superfamily enzyme
MHRPRPRASDNITGVTDLTGLAFPQRRRAGAPRRGYREWSRDRRINRDAQRAWLPPPRHVWAAFGESFIVPPMRVSNPDRIEIGDGVLIHENVWMSVVRHFPEVDTRLVFGDRTRVGRSCQFSVAGQVVLEHDVIVGDFVQIGDTSHPYLIEHDRMRHVLPPRPVRIGHGALLASHVVVLPGVTIGAGAYVDHHSVVTRDVPAGAVVGGNPAVAR